MRWEMVMKNEENSHGICLAVLRKLMQT